MPGSGCRVQGGPLEGMVEVPEFADLVGGAVWHI